MSKQQKTTYTLLMASVIGLAGVAKAEVSPNLDIKGKVWASWGMDMTSGAATHKQGFDLERTILQANYKFNDSWSSTLLFDAGRAGSTVNYLSAYVKNAYVQGNNLVGDGSTFRFGFQPTALISKVESELKTRWLGKTLVDQTALVPTHDGGVSLAGNANGVGYGIEARNGVEGLSLPGATDEAMAYDVWLSYGMAPAEGQKVDLTLYGSFRSKSATAGVAKRNVYAGALTFQHSMVDFGVEVASVNNNDVTALGYGATANIKFVEDSSLYARCFMGNDNFKTGYLGGKMLLTAGLTHALVKDKVSTALVYETKTSNTAGANAASAIYWKWAANF